MRNPLPALDAFARDTVAPAALLTAPSVAEWFALTQLAEQCAALPREERDTVRPLLIAALAPYADKRPTLYHEARPAPTDAWAMLGEQMRVAAESMERAGCLELAYTAVASTSRLLADPQCPTDLATTVHMGRIARQLGDLDTATDCYEFVTDEATRSRDDPMVARGLIGLALIAGTRGNRPAERAHYERALRLAHPGGPVEVQACQGIMSCAVNAGQLADALLYGWRAYDLIHDDQEVRAMVLSTLALTALAGGFPAPALAGFEHALTLCDTPRINLITRGGAMRAAARLQHVDRVTELFADGLDDVRHTSLPFENARYFVFAADAWVTLDDTTRATSCLQNARRLAEQFRFHEQLWQVDQLERAVSAIERQQVAAPVHLEVPFATDRANRRLLADIGRLQTLSR